MLNIVLDTKSLLQTEQSLDQIHEAAEHLPDALRIARFKMNLTQMEAANRVHVQVHRLQAVEQRKLDFADLTLAEVRAILILVGSVDDPEAPEPIDLDDDEMAPLEFEELTGVEAMFAPLPVIDGVEVYDTDVTPSEVAEMMTADVTKNICLVSLPEGGWLAMAATGAHRVKVNETLDSLPVREEWTRDQVAAHALAGMHFEVWESMRP